MKMFSEFFDEVGRGNTVDSDRLKRLFDIAMTKKLGVVKLPPSFWMQDPKINPRVDHLLWAALLLDDGERLSLAVSALAVEHDEQQKRKQPEEREPVGRILDRYVQQLLDLLPEENRQQQEMIRKKRMTIYDLEP